MTNRQIRIFISSTFQDMQEERNHLMTKTFPLLNRIARERNVSIVAVDLRWGINKAEEGENGKVVYTCLNEIDNSHPFFIGLLGNRYGWQPSAIDIESKDFSEHYPWIAQDIKQNLSITEIEMQYGALRQEIPVHAAFYIKNAVDNNSPLCSQNDEDEHLQRLKKQICHQNRYQWKYYDNVDDLGHQVEKDFTMLLDELFPKKQLSVIEKLRLEQSYFIESCSKSYYRRKEQHEHIDHFINSSDPILCISAPNGMGKSTLLANWVKDHIADNNLFYYFVGTTQDERNCNSIIYYFINELKYKYGLEFYNESNQKPDYRKAFEQLLTTPQLQDKKIVFVIDGIDQINDNIIFFLLPKSAPNVHFILSANKGTQTEHALRRDGYKMMDLKPLLEAERIEMAKRYLRYHSKNLEENQLRKIVTNNLTENTLVLRTLLDELLVFGVYEKLDERIDYYLSSISVEDFFERLIRRCEEVYGAQMVRTTLSLIAISRNGLTETDITQLLAVSQLNWSQFYCAIINHFIVKNDLISFSHEYILRAVEKHYFTNLDQKTKLHQSLGNYLLHESELRGKYTNNDFFEIPYQLLMGREFDKLYHFLLDVNVHDYLLLHSIDHNDWVLYWKSLYAQNPNKYSVTALLNVIGDDEMRLAELSLLTYGHLTIEDSELFAKKAVELTAGKGPIGEIAEQYLVRILSDKGDVDGAIQHLKVLMANTWNEMMYDNYENLMGELLVKKGSFAKARNWFFKVIERNEKLGLKFPLLGDSYKQTGFCFLVEQSYDNSIHYLLKALNLYKQSIGEVNNYVFGVLGLLAMAYFKKNDYNQSLIYYEQQLEMGIHLLGVDSESVKKICLDIANVYDKMGDQKKKEYYLAKSILGKTMSYFEKFNDLEQRALTYKQKGEYQYAINLFKEYILASENLGDVFASHRARIFAHIAFCYEKLKNNVQMLENWRFSSIEADKVKLSSLKSEERTNSTICNIYYNYGIFLYQNQQFYNSSVQLLKCIKLINDTKIRVEYYNNLLMTLWNSYRFLCEDCRAKSNYVDAQLWVNRMKDLCQQNNWEKTPEMGNVFAQQAMIHQGMGNFQSAIENLNEAIRLYKQSSDKFPQMIGSLYEYLGNIYRDKQSLNDAIVCYHESAKYYEKVSDTPKLSFVYNEIGMAKGRQGKFREALTYHNKALELAKLFYNNDYDPRLAGLYYNVGFSLIKSGKPKSGDEFVQFAKYISNNEQYR